MTSNGHVRAAPQTTCPAPPHIPREAWTTHPNFPEQTLLLGSHENFRRVSAILIERVRAAWAADASAQYPVWENLTLYGRWIMGMRSHEHYEEAKLYPYLVRRYGVSTLQLEEEHEELHTYDDAIRQAFSAMATNPDRDNLEKLAVALEAHDAHLQEHLIAEEDLVIPLLLSLTREEFAGYYKGHIDTLLANSKCVCEGAAAS